MVDRGEASWASLSSAEQKEMDEAVAMLTEAAAQGHIEAQAYLGDMYYFGRGVAGQSGSTCTSPWSNATPPGSI